MNQTTILPVGERIKTLREKRGLTLQELAEKLGFSSALLNQIENHLVSPPLGALIKIAKGLNVSLGEIWGEKGGESYVLTRKGEGGTVSRFASKEGISYGYSYNSLGAGMEDRHIEPFIITLEPPTVKKPEPSRHEGEEFLYVLSGRVEICLDGHTDIMEPGDSIQYSARLSHRLSCVGEEPAEMIAVIWSPEKKK